MKKVMAAAALSAAALAATPLLADQAEHRHGERSTATQATEHEHGAQHAQRHAEMQKRMEQRMAGRQHGEGIAQGGPRGEHQNRGEGCPMGQQAPKA